MSVTDATEREVAELNAADARESEDFAAQRDAQVVRFVKTNTDYYRKQFANIGGEAKFVWTFNLWAGVFGPIWFASRGMWNWGLTFLILETFAIVQIVRGGDQCKAGKC